MKHLKLKTKILKNLICYHMTCINPKKSLSDDVSSLNLMILTDVLLYLFVLYPYRCPVRCRRSTTSISNSPRRRHQLGFAIKPIFSPSPSPLMAASHNYQLRNAQLFCSEFSIAEFDFHQLKRCHFTSFILVT